MAQLDALLAAAHPPRWKTIFQFAALSGLRREEICALRWSDVDMRTGKIRVRRVLTADSRGRRILEDRTKTRAGAREFTLPQPALDALRLQRKLQAEERLRDAEPHEGDWVFTGQGTRGRPIHPSDVSKAFARIRKKAGLPEELTFHSLRHTCASLSLAGGGTWRLPSGQAAPRQQAVNLLAGADQNHQDDLGFRLQAVEHAMLPAGRGHGEAAQVLVSRQGFARLGGSGQPLEGAVVLPARFTVVLVQLFRDASRALDAPHVTTWARA